MEPGREGECLGGQHALEAGLERPDDRHPMVPVVDSPVTHACPS
jgi:hypothetical protein